MRKQRNLKISKAIVWAFSKIILGASTSIFLAGIICLAVFGAWQLLKSLVAPNISRLLTNQSPASSLIVDSQGKLLYEYYSKQKRQIVPLKDISPNLIHATIAVEDKDYFQHKGVWLPGIFRAALFDIHAKDAEHGGSTITQQLVKNVILTNDKSIARKLSEIVWSVEMEKNFSKEEILEKYLNLISYGRNSEGIEAASQSFFGKPAKDLSPLEAAYLASLPKAPSTLSPDGKNRPDLEKRKDYVLELMHEQHFLSDAEFDSNKNLTARFLPYQETLTAPHFVFLVIDEAKKLIGKERLTQGGLIIHTTLDGNLQAQAEEQIQNYIPEASRKFKANNASLVAIEPKSGSIKAYVGSANYFGEPFPKGCTPGKNCLFDPQRDAARSLRQPGSSFKPYVYVTAFGEKFKMTPASIISDSPTTFTGSDGSAYTPHNYTGKSYGNIPARKALAGSLNIAAVNLLAKIGQEDTIKTTRNLGVSAPLKNCGLSLALGACEMTLLEHTAAFAGLANMGNFFPPHAIAKITDHAGGIIMEIKNKPTRAVEAAASYEVLDIMSDNQARSYIFGSHSPLAFLDRQVAVKTGTTQNWRDSWTVGGTPDLTLGIWMGNNNGQVMRAGSDSIVTAAPLWRKILDTTINENTTKTFEEPFGISRVTVDTKTGKVIKPKNINSANLQPIADYAINIDIPKIAKPKVLGATRPSIQEDTEVATVILDPWENQTIFETPFEVKVYTGGSTEGATVSLNLDGHIIASKTSPPFFFTIPDNLQNGWHRLTATTNHFGLVETTDSIKFRTQFNPKPIKPRGE